MRRLRAAAATELAERPDDRDPDNLAARILELFVENRRADVGRVARLLAKARTTIPDSSNLAPEVDGGACYYYASLAARSPAHRAAWAATALDYGERAARLNPQATSPHACQAWALGNLGRFGEGLAQADYVIATHPLTANGYEARARIEFQQGRFGAALADFGELARREDGDPMDLGITDLFLGRYPAAAARLREQAVADPKDADAPFFLAAALELAGQHGAAVRQAGLYRQLRNNAVPGDSAIAAPDSWRTLTLSSEPAFVQAATKVRSALHAAGLDEPVR